MIAVQKIAYGGPARLTGLPVGRAPVDANQSVGGQPAEQAGDRPGDLHRQAGSVGDRPGDE